MKSVRGRTDVDSKLEAPSPPSRVPLRPGPEPLLMVEEPRPRSGRSNPKRFYAIAAVLVILLMVAAVATIYAVFRLLGPQDQDIDSSWVLDQTGAKSLQSRGLSGAGVVVCILDSGYDATHPDLSHARIAAWKDFIASEPEPYDDNGHGTYMGSLIVARGRVNGVAPQASLVVGKVIRGDGTGDDSTAATGIDFCLEKQADVISLSWGGKSRPLGQTRTESATSRALSLGVYVVASAGNDGPDNQDVASPASMSGVIAVGAVDRKGAIGPFSSQGANSPIDHPPIGRQDPDRKPETVASGVDVPGAWTEGRYVLGEGTSQATALVSGVIALLLEAHPAYKRAGTSMVATFKSRLMDSCRALAAQTTPHDDRYGYGLVDAVKLESLL